MWLLRPFEVGHVVASHDIDSVLSETLGSGAEVLARYISSILDPSQEEYNIRDPTDIGGVDTNEEDDGSPISHPPPPSVLCHICDRHIQPWFFEKHAELCVLSHKAESIVQECQDVLRDHRQVLVRMLDTLGRAHARTESPTGHGHGQSGGGAEYRGLRIMSLPTSMPSGSPTSSSPKSSSPMSGKSFFSKHSATSSVSSLSPRARATITRRPQIRILDTLLDLCDTALQISTPSVKEDSANLPIEEMRVQSPESENRITQILQWQSPNIDDPAISLLANDTLSCVNAKVDAVLRLRNIITYSERIRQELNVQVEDVIEAAFTRRAYEDEYAIIDEERLQPTSSSQQGDTTFEQEHSMTDEDTTAKIVLGQEVETSMDEIAPNVSIRPPERLIPVEHGRKPSMKRYIQASLADDSSTDSSIVSPTIRKSSPLIGKLEDDGADSDHSQSSSLNVPPSKFPAEMAEFLPRAPSRGQSQRGLYASPRRLPSPARTRSPSRHASPSPLRPMSQKPFLENTSPLHSPILTSAESLDLVTPLHHHRRASSQSEHLSRIPPLSPRMPSISASSRPAPPSIRDFDVIKPISKGAFGSVYLTRKKTTGDYYAIKVLKKADMISKNQVTNVRAERAILMAQGESPFVAKLFFTFQSKEYLYLVMEYLNGGDCAALIKSLGGLPEEWARKYLAEVILGVEYLHRHGIVHRYGL